MTLKNLTTLAAALPLLAVLTWAEDVTCFRGPDRQGVFNETNLLKTWPPSGPKQLWKTEGIGQGWGAVIRVQGRLYVTGGGPTAKVDEKLTCLDDNGKVLWQMTTGKTWAKSFQYARSTPTFVDTPDGGRLYLSTGGGEIFCVKADDGAIVWKHDFAADYGGRPGSWGYAESIAAADGMVFATPVGNKASMVAYDQKTGKVAWEAAPLDGIAAYVTPVVHNGQIIQITGTYVFGADVKTGKIRWKFDFASAFEEKGRREISCVTPLVSGRRIFATRGYNHGSVMLEVAPDGNSVKLLWKNKDLDTQHGGVVHLNGRIYGSTWINNGSGEWACLDAQTGRTIFMQPWQTPGKDGQPPPVDKDGKPVPLGKGITFAADGMLYQLEEKRGTLALVRPGKDGLDIVSSFNITYGAQEYWSCPVISDGVLYVRRGDVLAAYNVKAE